MDNLNKSDLPYQCRITTLYAKLATLHVAIYWKIYDALACTHAVLDDDIVSLAGVLPP